MWKFKQDNTLEYRKEESSKIMRYWPDKIPIILEKHGISKLSEIPKAKFLCPRNYSFFQFNSCLRAKLKLESNQAIYVFANEKKLVTGDKSLLELYEESKDQDGFLYLMYCEHETLGCDYS
ncbi:hypothetical protein SteCoe_15962 [Stentor coeruleus]|uniref:Autophagy-related protein n=1 Tax=Stentor coeruleus TaxID=5963 RepID=A0A1R2C2B4_9CILI|nr:hypothetical protein SteCoe_19415 [Stentor coeruleus]OMJ83183.1 hypothetical protein SteCoe_15962 [Stentor coeruleus]